MKRIAILGAGITGLTLAFKLSSEGNDITVFEKSKNIGGLARTIKFNEQYYDLGPHEFCTNNPVIVKLLHELLGKDFLVCTKKAAQHFRGKYVDYPIKPLHFSRQIEASLFFKVLFEVCYYRMKSLIWEYEDYSFKNWVEKRYGKTMYATYFGPYTKKVWGVDPDQLDPRTASDRIAFNSVFDILYQTAQFIFLKKEQYNSIHNPLKSQFYYCRSGIGKLAERLAERCKEQGCVIMNDWDIKKVRIRESRIDEIVNSSNESANDFDFYINTIPITVLEKAIEPNLVCSDLFFRSMIFCLLEIPKNQLTPFHWVYFPEAEISFQRMTEFSHFKADMTKPGYTGICLEISCFEDEPVWKLSDADVLNMVKEELKALGLLKDLNGIQGMIHRERFVYPVQISGFLEKIQLSLNRLKDIKNLITTGRQGLYKYCNMNECMEMALELAECEAEVRELPIQLSSKWKGTGLEIERTL